MSNEVANQRPQEVSKIHPEVSNFFQQYAEMSQTLKEAQATIAEQHNLIETQKNQLDDMRELLREVSAKSDYYMRLCVEMRTHFVAIQTLAREAEKCFTAGPQRNNGAVDKNIIKMDQLANDIDNHVVSETEKEEIAEKNEKLATPVTPVTIPTMAPDDKIPSFLSKPMNKVKGKDWSK